MEIWNQTILAALLACFAAGILHHAYLLRYLREHHLQVWERLGSPSMILNNSIANTRKLRAYLGAGVHEQLGDPELVRIVRRNRILERAYVVLLAAFALRMLAAGSGS